MKASLALCRTDSDYFDMERQEIQRLFSPQRLEAVRRRTAAEQKRTAAGQWLLRELLRREQPDLEFPPRFVYGQQEKPFLEDYPHLYFNISHSGNWAACVLSIVPVGVDVQEPRLIRPPLLRKFAPEEQKMLENYPENRRNSAVLDLWTLKEAYCKCTGEGLGLPLSAVAFTLEPLTIQREGYTVFLPEAPEKEYHLALCLRTEEPISLNSVILTPPKGIEA